MRLDRRKNIERQPQSSDLIKRHLTVGMRVRRAPVSNGSRNLSILSSGCYNEYAKPLQSIVFAVRPARTSRKQQDNSPYAVVWVSPFGLGFEIETAAVGSSVSVVRLNADMPNQNGDGTQVSWATLSDVMTFSKEGDGSISCNIKSTDSAENAGLTLAHKVTYACPTEDVDGCRLHKLIAGEVSFNTESSWSQDGSNRNSFNRINVVDAGPF